MGHYLFVAASGMLIWGIIAPSSAAQFVQSLFLVALRPVVVIQNGIADGIAYLRGVIDGLREQLGGPVRILGSLVQLLIFLLLTCSGFYIAILSIAGILGQDSAVELPASLEVMTGASMVLGLAYLFAILLELGGMVHFGHWTGLSAGPRKFVAISAAALMGLGICVSILLGYARADLESLTTEELQLVQTGLADGGQDAARWVLVLLPIFIDLTAAVAFFGAISGPLVLFAMLVWCVQLALSLINVVPAIAVQMLDALLGAVQAFLRFLAQIGEVLGLSIEQAARNEAPAEEQEAPLLVDRVSAVATDNNNNDGNGHRPQVGEPPQGPQDAPEPELTPIEEEHLDPLGIGRPT